jgi:tetratricopeptide (TPR) repeat protein
MHGPKDPDEHHADLPQLACTLYELISILIRYGELADPSWRDKCHAAFAGRDKDYEKSVRLKPLQKKDMPGRGHWARILMIDPGINDTAGKYLYDPAKYLEDKPLRKTFKGLSFNQVDRASRVLVKEFGLAADTALPVLDEDESTWGRVFKRAIVQLTEDISRRAPGALDGNDDYWLPASNVKILIPACFMGRDTTLVEIDEALYRHPNRVSMVVLHGLRGVGKTIVAATYSHEHRGDYRATWWINAAAEPSIRSTLAALGRRLGWVLPDQPDDMAIPTVITNLANTADDMLLIFDNASEPKAILPFIPQAGRCKILITSTWDAWRKNATQIAIEPWPLATGADFLIARTPDAKSPHDRSAGEALSDDLGGLPLALEQAAAYCEGEGVSFAEYRRLFAEKKLQLLDDYEHAPPEYGLTVASTFGLAIDAAKRRHEAAELLIIFAALLAPEPVPLFLFAEVEELFPEPLNSALSRGQLNRIVASLRAFALVNRERITDSIDPDVATDTIRLHPLVREVAASRVAGDILAQSKRYMFVAIARRFPADADLDPKVWPRCDSLRPHVMELWQSDPHTFANAEDWAFVLDKMGCYYRGRGGLDAAAVVFEYVVQLLESVFGRDHLAVTRAYNNLAVTLSKKGEFAAAYELMMRVRQVCERELEPDHPELATIFETLGILLRQQGKRNDALVLFKRALAIAEKAFGPNHPVSARCAVSAAGLLEEMNDHVTAMKLYQQCLAILETAEGPNSVGVAACLTGIANLLQTHHAPADALPLIERSLQIAKRLYGPDHPQLIPHLSNLGGALLGLRRFSEAHEPLNRAIALSEDFYGPKHIQTAQLYRNLSVLLWYERDPRWRPLSIRALMVFEDRLGVHHPETREFRTERRRYKLHWYFRKGRLPTIVIASSAAVLWLVWYIGF